MAKKNVSIESIIEYGYEEQFYCYQFPQKQYSQVVKNIKNSKCFIIGFDTVHNSEISALESKEFKKYLQQYIEKESKAIEDKINDDFKNNDSIKDEIALESEKNNYQSLDDLRVPIKIKVVPEIQNFINDQKEFNIQYIMENSIYFNKSTSIFSEIFIVQPLKFIKNKDEEFINVKVVIFNTGHICIEYSIPLRNVEFSELSNITGLQQKVYVPEYILNNNEDYDYKEQLEIKNAIKKYNTYLINLLKIKTNIESEFTNYILVDYTNKPTEFGRMSDQLSKEFYWLLNYPYGIINEREAEEYNVLKNNRYSISAYASLFASSYGRTIIAYNKKCKTLDNLNLDNNKLYNISKIYINFIIEIILIKKTCYLGVINSKISYNTSLNQLMKEYSNVISINDFIFRITLHSYGSILRTLEYLEKKLINYLPTKEVDNIITNYKEFILIKESKTTEKQNHIIALIASVFPVMFGLPVIKDMTEYLDLYLISKNIDNMSFNQYYVDIWIIIIILLLMFLWGIPFLKFIIEKIKLIYGEIKLIVKKLYHTAKPILSKLLKI